MTPKLRGNIKSLMLDRGYGWIAGDDGIDRFFHRRGVEMTSAVAFHEMQVDARVEFIGINAVKGPRAIEIRVLPVSK